MADRDIRRRPYGAPNVDGFRDDEETPVAYCPREKRKKKKEEHEKCDCHAGEDAGEEASEAARCSFDEKAGDDADGEEAQE